MLIAFYFLLIDGHRLVGWLERVAPLPPGRFRSFLSEFRGVSRAVVISTVGTGAVQAAAALVGYLIARVPHPFFVSTCSSDFMICTSRRQRLRPSPVPEKA